MVTTLELPHRHLEFELFDIQVNYLGPNLFPAEVLHDV